MSVQRFVEKPDASTAQKYLDEGGYYWNAGMFVLKASVWLQALEQFRKTSSSHQASLGQTKHRRQPWHIPLEIIEVQSGSYLEKDDIVHVENSYLRAQS